MYCFFFIEVKGIVYPSQHIKSISFHEGLHGTNMNYQYFLFAYNETNLLTRHVYFELENDNSILAKVP